MRRPTSPGPVSRPSRLRRLSWLALGAVTAACSTTDDEAPVPQQTGKTGVYSEVTDFAEVQAHLGLLRSHGLGLYQVMSPADFRSAGLRSLIDACAASGIQFRAWIVLPEGQGYWPGETNAAEFGQAVDEFLAWVQQDALPVGWITIDMEPSWEYAEQILAIAQDENNPDALYDLIALIESHHDPASFAAATAQYQAIVQRIHDAGLQAHVVTDPFVLDDPADGDADIQDGFDIPIEGIAWDEATFMTYRNVMETFVGGPVDTSLFYSYGLDAKQWFGEQAGLDFGIVGTGVVAIEGGYEQPESLRADVAAARAANIDRLHLYCFEGTRAEPHPEQWLDFATTPPAPVPDGGAGEHAFRNMFKLLDDYLDDAP